MGHLQKHRHPQGLHHWGKCLSLPQQPLTAYRSSGRRWGPWVAPSSWENVDRTNLSCTGCPSCRGLQRNVMSYLPCGQHCMLLSFISHFPNEHDLYVFPLSLPVLSPHPWQTISLESKHSSFSWSCICFVADLTFNDMSMKLLYNPIILMPIFPSEV